MNPINNNLELENIEAIGSWIKGRRNYKRLTQTQLAKRSGLSLNMIHRMEEGKGNTNALNIKKALNALGVEVKFGLKINDLQKNIW